MRIWKALRIVVGVLLVIAGIGCFLYPNIRDRRTQGEVDKIVKTFDTLKHTESVAGEDKSETSDIEKTDSVTKVFPELYAKLQDYNTHLTTSEQAIEDAWDGANGDFSIDISEIGSDSIGYIEIPDMKVRLPLYLGTTDDHLAKGAAVVSGTSMPIGGEDSNCVIAAHRGWRGSAFFQFIDRMQAGSKVYITTPWETLTYTTVGVDIVDPSDTDSIAIQQGKDMVTLISCHPYVLGGGPERYLVYCERYEESSGDTFTDEETKTLPQIELPESSDTDDDLLDLEVKLRTILPAVTLVLCGLIIFVRSVRNRKK